MQDMFEAIYMVKRNQKSMDEKNDWKGKRTV